MNSNSTPYPSFVVISPQATCKLVLLTKLPCFDGSRATTSLWSSVVYQNGEALSVYVAEKIGKARVQNGNNNNSNNNNNNDTNNSFYIKIIMMITAIIIIIIIIITSHKSQVTRIVKAFLKRLPFCKEWFHSIIWWIGQDKSKSPRSFRAFGDTFSVSILVMIISEYTAVESKKFCDFFCLEGGSTIQIYILGFKSIDRLSPRKSHKCLLKKSKKKKPKNGPRHGIHHTPSSKTLTVSHDQTLRLDFFGCAPRCLAHGTREVSCQTSENISWTSCISPQKIRVNQTPCGHWDAFLESSIEIFDPNFARKKDRVNLFGKVVAF